MNPLDKKEVVKRLKDIVQSCHPTGVLKQKIESLIAFAKDMSDLEEDLRNS